MNEIRSTDVDVDPTDRTRERTTARTNERVSNERAREDSRLATPESRPDVPRRDVSCRRRATVAEALALAPSPSIRPRRDRVDNATGRDRDRARDRDRREGTRGGSSLVDLICDGDPPTSRACVGRGDASRPSTSHERRGRAGDIAARAWIASTRAVGVGLMMMGCVCYVTHDARRMGGGCGCVGTGRRGEETTTLTLTPRDR